MSNFRVGQRIVCVRAQFPFIEINKIYTISSVYRCKTCQEYSLTVYECDSLPTPGTICDCGGVEYGIIGFDVNRFRPIHHTLISNRSIIKETVPEKLDVEIEEPVENN